MNRPRFRRRGSTLVEAMIAAAVFLVALAGLLPLQVMGARLNRFSDRTFAATSLATDLTENIARWDYSDARLLPLTTVSSFGDSSIASTWDMGSSSHASYTAQYSDSPATDHNASTSNALGSTYQGFSSDVDGDGAPDFTRYWNVYAVDLTGSGTPSGKLVQVIVRWNEPSVGWHQVAVTTFKRNPANVF
jgi:Tfp pilus assembly protein PilV